MLKKLFSHSVMVLAVATICGCCNTKKYEEATSTMNILDFSNVKSADVFKKEVIDDGGIVDFAFGKDRPFKQSHASTIEEAEDGIIVVAWFGGSHEKAPDVGIWSSYYANGKWSCPMLVAKVNETAHWNPVLFKDQNELVHLYFKVGAEISQWQTYVMTSADGKTWSKPVELVKGDIGGRGPVKNQPIILSNGTWIAPSSQEITGWKSFVDISKDNGKTWQKSKFFGGPIVENEIVKKFRRAGYIKNVSPEDIRKILDQKKYNKILTLIDPKKAVWCLVNDGINIRINRIPEDPKALKEMSETGEWSNIYSKTVSDIIRKVNNNEIQSVLADPAQKQKLLEGMYTVVKDSLTNGPIQPALWESAPGKVHALMRTPAGSLWRVDSEDYGKTWGDVYDTGIPNNNSGIDLVKLNTGRLVLILNPIAQNWGPRSPLTMMISDDNGLTWKAIANLEDEGAYLGDEEFSYPTIIRTKDDGVIISYTWKRDDVKVWKIPGKVLKEY
jgi:predicted neuraminidase